MSEETLIRQEMEKRDKKKFSNKWKKFKQKMHEREMANLKKKKMKLYEKRHKLEAKAAIIKDMRSERAKIGAAKKSMEGGGFKKAKKGLLKGLDKFLSEKPQRKKRRKRTNLGGENLFGRGKGGWF